MSTIIEKLNEILAIKKDIKQAIRDKGVEMKDETPFAEYPDIIRDIKTNSGDDGSYESLFIAITRDNTNYESLFRDYKGEELDVSNLDTSNVETMADMFSSCSNLTKLDLDNFNTSNVRCINGMFDGCNNLTSLDLSNFNTSNVEDMSGMFWGCNNLETLDLNNWVINENTNVNNMFGDCDNLRSLYLVGCSNETISKIINDSNLPTGPWEGEMRIIFCRVEDKGDLRAPNGWDFNHKE